MRDSTQVKTEARDYFEKWALYYDRSWLNELVFYPSVRACQEEIVRRRAARGTPEFEMLDVGCGTGTLLAMAARDNNATRLVGLDFSTEMVSRAAEKFAKTDHADKLSAIDGDAEHLPFDDESFDVLTCCNSFHHYPEQAKAIAEFHRVLRPGGMLILIDGFRDNVIGWVIFDVFVAGVEKDVHHAAWSRVRDMIREAGFPDFRQSKLNVLVPLLVSVATR